MSETKPGSSLIWWILGVVFVLGWCLYLAFFGPTPPPPSRAPVLAGTALSKPADYGLTLYDLEGHAVPFEQYRGKTVFMNVWATWCRPCIEELPSIVQLARMPQLKRVAFVCVSIDQDPQTVRQYVAENGKDWPMTVLRATTLPPAFSSTGVPTTFLIAPDGRIAASALGGADWDDPSVVDFLQRLDSANDERAKKTE